MSKDNDGLSWSSEDDTRPDAAQFDPGHVPDGEPPAQWEPFTVHDTVPGWEADALEELAEADQDRTDESNARDVPLSNDWEDIGEFVHRTTTDMVSILFDDSLEGVEALDLSALAPDVLDELQDALEPSDPPQPPTVPTRPNYDNQEVEIIEEVDEADITGVVLVDTDTGEELETFDSGVIESGFYLLDELEDSELPDGLKAPPSPPPRPKSPRQDLPETDDEDSSSGEPDGDRQDPAAPQRNVSIKLEGLADRIELKPEWAQLIQELNLELRHDRDPVRRAGTLFVLGHVVRGVAGDSAAALGADDIFDVVSESGGAVLRSVILDRLARNWRVAGPGFFDTLERLERLDERNEGAEAGLRRSSIATERLLDGELDEEGRARLLRMTIPPESFAAYVGRMADATRARDGSAAIDAWRGVARTSRGILRKGALAVAAQLAQRTPGFFSLVDELQRETRLTRTIFLIAQREAFAQGDRYQEARALKRLISQDVKRGLADGNSEGGRTRHKHETASRLFRLSTLLRGLDGLSVADRGELGGLDSYQVLKDATALHATDLTYLRRLARWAEQRGDWETLGRALASIANEVDEPQVRAVMWERLAALSERRGDDPDVVRGYLGESLRARPDCLPALISLGQSMILEERWDEMLALRGTPADNDPTLHSAWRRAELLERAGGSPREVLELYQRAREGAPDSVHLFFCVERALSRVGEWKKLVALYGTASTLSSPLGETLHRTGFNANVPRLAASIFLADESVPDYDTMVDILERSPLGEDDATAQFGIDETILWRVAAEECERGMDRQALTRAEIATQLGGRELDTRRARALVWRTWLLDERLQQPERALGSFRELSNFGGSPKLRRYAIEGLLRAGDFAWLADALMESEDDVGWPVPAGRRSDTYRWRVAAELLALGEETERALDTWSAALTNAEDDERVEIAERAICHAVRGRAWSRSVPFLPIAFSHVDRRTLAEFSRHLAVADADAAASLEALDNSGLTTPPDARVLLSELELAYRSSDWERARSLLNRGLATAEASSIDFRAFLLEQAILISEWGEGSPEVTLTYVEDLWTLEQARGGAPIFAIAAMLRTHLRLGHHSAFEEWVSTIRRDFTPTVAEALVAEGRMRVGEEGIDAVVQWYKSRLATVPQPMRPYYQWMIAALRWLFDDRDRRAIQLLADADAQSDPTHGVGGYLVAIGFRQANMHASCERQLSSLAQPGRPRPVREWANVRSLFHIAVGQDRLDDAIVELEEEERYEVYAWLPIATEFFSRALRRKKVAARLRSRAKESAGKLSLEVEIAELLGDSGEIPRLADAGDPSAFLSVVRSGQLDEPLDPETDVRHQFAELGEALSHGSQDDARRFFVDHATNLDEVFWGSPWCPLRAVTDLTRLGLEEDELDRLFDVVKEMSDDGVGAEVRLAVARQYLRHGVRQQAHELMPHELGGELVSVAWSLFNVAVDPYGRDAKSRRWSLSFWERRRSEAGRRIGAELHYEVGRYLELSGEPEEALGAYRSALGEHPNFLPAQVAAGRILITNRDWLGLAELWEAEMQNTDDDAVLASVAFRLGFLFERRLPNHPESEVRAEEAYLRVLRVRPNHLPTLYALLDIAYRQRNFDAAARYLEHMIELSPSRPLKVSYLIELGHLREHRLEDSANALEHFRRAHALRLDSVEALMGILRNDTEGTHIAQAFEERLDSGVTEIEGRDLADQLYALSSTSSAARGILDDRFPQHYPRLLSRLVQAALHFDVDHAAGRLLERSYGDSETKRVMRDLARVARRSAPGTDELAEAATVGTGPQAEGAVIRAMYWALQRRDLELQGRLAATRARRAHGEILRAAELTWMTAAKALRGDYGQALEMCRTLADAHGDFLPLLKLAKVLSNAQKSWEEVVMWHEREARITCVDTIAQADRLHASEVQRKYLGDFDAALEQIRTVLADDPTHADAFGKMKDILMTRRRFPELLEAYEDRVEATDSNEEKCGLLNEMAEIALNHLRDRRTAIRLLSRSLERKPNQLRRLRVLAELYESEEEWGRAVSCHRAAADLVEDADLLAKMWRHIGFLYEKKLDKTKAARAAFSTALSNDPNSEPLTAALARTTEASGDFEKAAELYAKIRGRGRDEVLVRQARVGIARIASRHGTDDDAIEALRDVVLHHPEHMPSVQHLSERLVRRGHHSDLREIFRDLAYQGLRLRPQRGFEEHFVIARHLGHADRAFTLAAVARARGTLSEEMQSYYDGKRLPRRWPGRAIDPDVTTGLLPAQLVAPFLELLRLTNEGLIEGMEKLPGEGAIRRPNRIKEPDSKALKLAHRWPLLFSMEVRDAFWSPSRIPGGSAVIIDGGVRLVLDRTWKDNPEPSGHLIALGRQLAAWSMGVGAWSLLDLDAQASLFIAIVSNYVPGWNSAPRSHLPKIINYPRIQRWLQRKGDRAAAYALEISGRFSSAAIQQQFQALRVATERLACVVVDDPGEALRNARFGDTSELLDEPPWLFFLSAPALKVRANIGVALSDE